MIIIVLYLMYSILFYLLYSIICGSQIGNSGSCCFFRMCFLRWRSLCISWKNTSITVSWVSVRSPLSGKCRDWIPRSSIIPSNH